MADSPVYTLYHFPFSLYSLMVRLAFAFGEKLSPENAPRIKLKLVNLHLQENLSEDFLILNPRGQVPVLASPALSEPLTESYEIAKWLSLQQTDLIPEEHNVIITKIMNDLHEIHAQALALSPDICKDGIPNQAAAMLEQNKLTASHRRCLEIKSIFHDNLYSDLLDPDNITLIEEKVLRFVDSIGDIIKNRPPAAFYLFGDKPTLLDAHAAAFLAHLIDLQRLDLLPNPTVRDYALGIISTSEWQHITQGLRTVWDESVESVEGLYLT
ncbi:unnamed protein product [Clonostachys byssicola]|uniref:GST N-terminal domain-containing protein n=1 Tax=Clonostachys byssicola TaxID=160290 RepID=A0A9N9ULX7_9HYPO|nr:unnamed protein product [Clonostachys byssicola]